MEIMGNGWIGGNDERVLRKKGCFLMFLCDEWGWYMMGCFAARCEWHVSWCCFVHINV